MQRVSYALVLSELCDANELRDKRDVLNIHGFKRVLLSSLLT
jgi:hypothetical protein